MGEGVETTCRHRIFQKVFCERKQKKEGSLKKIYIKKVFNRQKVPVHVCLGQNSSLERERR